MISIRSALPRLIQVKHTIHVVAMVVCISVYKWTIVSISIQSLLLI